MQHATRCQIAQCTDAMHYITKPFHFWRITFSPPHTYGSFVIKEKPGNKNILIILIGYDMYFFSRRDTI
jgi:hypothetical protein